MSHALAELLRGVELVSTSGAIENVRVAEVRDDSRKVQPGDLFVAAPGPVADGRAFVTDAIARGATALVTEGAAPTSFPGLVVLVPQARHALGLIAANRFGAAAALSLHAITGTNGKTTTSYLVEGMLRAAGRVPGVVGTVAYRSAAPGFATVDAPNTTPGALLLHSVLADMRAAGTTDVALEATSQALDQNRLDGCAFRVAALTNVTQDHLDYHGTMDRYFDAKAILFERMLAPNGVGVVFVDKDEGVRMRARCPRPVVGVATQAMKTAGADVVAGIAVMDDRGVRVSFSTPMGPVKIDSPLVGDFNLENLAIAVGMGVAADLPVSAIESGLAGVAGVPGRLERVPNGRGVLCVVDYAHTPDGLARAIAALKPYARGRLVVVFGCGGDRDRRKRPMMGKIAGAGADLSIVTSDNPRTEDADAIIDMIVPGLEEGLARPVSTAQARSWIRPSEAMGRTYCRVTDRRAAIQLATALALPGDVLLIAGKGHEDYQIVGTTRSHFDDREEAAVGFALAEANA
ncbi:MAG TPA: UDP-N-acetylmuramoyl-L-alanyl-D-glutamate--2,6-diaminopimelate ligase [Polyangia bacterium]|nr:UDP-N-acetylmuramoyl-L-alanyl-D-glutamate--2,6-diaminopimelate ligase [Polyangia bacterium]